MLITQPSGLCLSKLSLSKTVVTPSKVINDVELRRASKIYCIRPIIWCLKQRKSVNSQHIFRYFDAVITLLLDVE